MGNVSQAQEVKNGTEHYYSYNEDKLIRYINSNDEQIEYEEYTQHKCDIHPQEIFGCLWKDGYYAIISTLVCSLPWLPTVNEQR